MIRDLTYFWAISRPANVLISLLAFGVSCFMANDKSTSFIHDGSFWAVAMMIATIASTGYWVNDVYDFRIDRINKPNRTIVNAKLSVKKVLSAYFIINGLISLFTIGYFALYKGFYQITFINLTSILLLFWYASQLKRRGVAGNLVISFLIVLVVLLAGYLYEVNMPIVWILMFSFQITFIREITKDVEDIKGDLAYKLRTLPIQIGIRNTRYILLILYIVFLISCNMPLLYYYYRTDIFLWRYLLASLSLVQLPMIYLIHLLTQAAFPSDFARQSKYLKYIMVTGIATVLLLI